MNKKLYNLLKLRTTENGLPIMDSTHFQKFTEDFGKQVFRKTLAEFIKKEKPSYPLKEFEEGKVIKTFKQLVSIN